MWSYVLFGVLSALAEKTDSHVTRNSTIPMVSLSYRSYHWGTIIHIRLILILGHNRHETVAEIEKPNFLRGNLNGVSLRVRELRLQGHLLRSGGQGSPPWHLTWAAHSNICYWTGTDCFFFCSGKLPLFPSTNFCNLYQIISNLKLIFYS